MEWKFENESQSCKLAISRDLNHIRSCVPCRRQIQSKHSTYKSIQSPDPILLQIQFKLEIEEQGRGSFLRSSCRCSFFLHDQLSCGTAATDSESCEYGFGKSQLAKLALLEMDGLRDWLEFPPIIFTFESVIILRCPYTKFGCDFVTLLGKMCVWGRSGRSFSIDKKKLLSN